MRTSRSSEFDRWDNGLVNCDGNLPDELDLVNVYLGIVYSDDNAVYHNDDHQHDDDDNPTAYNGGIRVLFVGQLRVGVFVGGLLDDSWCWR